MATARVAPEEKESSAFLPSAFNQEQFFDRNVNMSYESYSDQMKNPLWQKKRLHMLESKGWKCEMCGCGEKDAKTFHVHHKQYKSGAKIWEYEDEWLSVLCDKCHKETHQLLDNIKQAIVDTPIEHLSAIADCAGYVSDQKEDVDTYFNGDARKLSWAMESIFPIVRKYGFEKWMNLQGYMCDIHPELERTYFDCIKDITKKFFDASNKLWDVYQEKEYNWEYDGSDKDTDEQTNEEDNNQESLSKKESQDNEDIWLKAAEIEYTKESAKEDEEVIKSFISSSEKNQIENKNEVKLDSEPFQKKRTKSANIQLLLYPEIKKALKEESETSGRSMNDICNYVLAEAIGLKKEFY